MSFLKKAWDWMLQKPPQIPEAQRSMWAYAKPGIETPPGLVLLAEYDNKTGYYTLTRGIMDHENHCLKPLHPLADQPNAMGTREAVLGLFDQLRSLPANITLNPEDRIPHATHVSICYQELKGVLGLKQELAL